MFPLYCEFEKSDLKFPMQAFAEDPEPRFYMPWKINILSTRLTPYYFPRAVACKTGTIGFLLEVISFLSGDAVFQSPKTLDYPNLECLSICFSRIYYVEQEHLLDSWGPWAWIVNPRRTLKFLNTGGVVHLLKVQRIGFMQQDWSGYALFFYFNSSLGL